MLQEMRGSQKHYCKDWGEQGEHSLKDLQGIVFSKVHEEALLQGYQNGSVQWVLWHAHKICVIFTCV